MAKRRSQRPQRPVAARPEDVVLFCDRNLGREKVPTRLRQDHADVITHDERFAQDANDETWLRAAGRKRWVVLTRDERIRYRPGEQQALMDAGVACFCLHPSKGMTGDDMADVIARALPRILQIATSEPPPYIKGVNRRGRVRHLYPARKRRA